MAEAIREFIPDPSTGTLKVIFTDAGSGLEIPLSELINFDVLGANGLGDLVPIDAGADVGAPSTDDSLGISPSVGKVVLPPKGTGTEQGPYGDGQGRTQSNNFGYLSKPGILSATKFAGPIGQVAGALGATGLLGPLGAVSTAGKLANGLVNNNNALAASSARQSLGLNPSSAARIAKETYSDNKGRVADINANGQTYSVGLEAMTEDGRTTLTPEEGRRRSLGMAATEATSQESKANAKGFKAEGFPSQKGFLGKIADQVLGRTPEATSMASTPTPTLDAFNGSPVGVTSAVERSNLPSQPETKGISVQGSVASNLGVNMSGTGLLGQPSKSMPSFSELSATPTSAIPSVPASKLGAVNTGIIGSPTSLNQPTDPTPGLAGISSSFKAGKFGTIETMDKEHLDPSINKALGAISEAVGPGVGVNSAYRDTAYNAKVNGKKQSQHLLGKAVDVNTVGWTPEQKAAALDAAAVAGVKGVGISKKGTMMHLDTRANPTTWGYSAVTADDVPMGIEEAPGWAQDSLRAIEGAGVGLSPGPRFGPTPTNRVDALATAQPATPEAVASSQVGIGMAPANVTNAGLGSMVNNDVGKMSVGSLSNQGFAPNYTDEEVNTMAVAAAGELGPRTLQGVARQDPAAMAELSSVVSTMQNRIAEKGIAGIKDPSQFNAFSTSTLPNGTVPATVTKANFETFGGSLIEGVKAAISGVAQSLTPDATHYADRDVGYAANKSYNKDMTGVAKVGDHTFGTIKGEFDQKKSAAAQEQEARAKQAVANFSEYSGIARNEQKADRKTANVTGLASTGLGSVNGAKVAKEVSKSLDSTESKTKDTKSNSGFSNSYGNSKDRGSGSETSGSGGDSSVPSKGSDGGVTGPSTSAPSGDGGGGKGKGVGSSKSKDKDKDSSGAKGAAGARS